MSGINHSKRTVVEDLPRAGRSSTSTDDDYVNKVKQIVLQNCRVNVREIVRDISIPKTTVHRILTDFLRMARVSAQLVPKHLNFL